MNKINDNLYKLQQLEDDLKAVGLERIAERIYLPRVEIKNNFTYYNDIGNEYNEDFLKGIAEEIFNSDLSPATTGTLIEILDNLIFAKRKDDNG